MSLALRLAILLTCKHGYVHKRINFVVDDHQCLHVFHPHYKCILDRLVEHKFQNLFATNVDQAMEDPGKLVSVQHNTKVLVHNNTN